MSNGVEMNSNEKGRCDEVHFSTLDRGFFDRSGFLITHKTTKICANTRGIHHAWEHFLSL